VQCSLSAEYKTLALDAEKRKLVQLCYWQLAKSLENFLVGNRMLLMLGGFGEDDFSRFKSGRRDKIADCHILLLGSFYDFGSLFF
jgi:hypothetical protein